MKQKQYSPMSVAEMALTIYAVNNGYFDKVPLNKVTDFEHGLQSFVKSNHKQVLDDINTTPKLSKENEAALKKAIEAFVSTGTY
jgi:F-type H+/Na+-transporting ATPase subunit alpha